jgi:hypothetical protein
VNSIFVWSTGLTARTLSLPQCIDFSIDEEPKHLLGHRLCSARSFVLFVASRNCVQFSES